MNKTNNKTLNTSEKPLAEKGNAEKPFVIGLCGGIGSGKSSAAQILSKLGAYIIDTDEVSRAVTAQGSECNLSLIAAFPQCVADGVLQRALLKSYIFANDDARKLLNSITHPYIFAETIRQIQGRRLVVVQVPLLFESGFNSLCDITICITASSDIRIQRIAKRDKIPSKLITAIMATQFSDEILIKKCDFSIDNSGGLNDLETNIKECFAKIKPLMQRLNGTLKRE